MRQSIFLFSLVWGATAFCSIAEQARSGSDAAPSCVAQVALGPKVAWNGGVNAADPAKRQVIANSMRGYFLMNYLYRNGKLQDVIDSLDKFQKMGVKLLWLNPVHEQTVMHWKNPLSTLDTKDPALGIEDNPFKGARDDAQEHNNHGYWVSDHFSVAQRLGGPEKLKTLVIEARKRGIEICLDTVLNHFGYPADESVRFKIGDEWVHPGNEEFFKSVYGRTRHYQVPVNLYRTLSSADEASAARSAQKELAVYALENLAALEHKNPKVQQYLIDAYKYFFDEMGIRTFRIDAAKHYSQKFLAQFINALNDHAASKGEQITFIVEFLEYRDSVLDVFVNDLVAAVKDSSLLFFLDFPLARELRRLHYDEASESKRLPYQNLKGHITYRDSTRPTSRMIPMVEDHDLSSPISDEFFDRMIYITAEFFSYNPVVLFHGNEGNRAPQQARSLIDDVDPDGAVAKYVNRLGEALAPYRATASFKTSHFHAAEGDFMLVEKARDTNHSIFLMTEKSGQAGFQATVQLPTHLNGRDFRFVMGGNGSELAIREVSGGYELYEMNDTKRILAELSVEHKGPGLVLNVRSYDKFFAVFEMVTP
ncbi:hypothetical protein K2X33_11075 [bacterium]|nr:hypothetical protein [bacterium]